MPFQIIENNILNVRCEAMVDPTDERLSGEAGLDAQIRKSSAAELQRECAELPPLAVGSATLTRAYRDNCAFLIHTAVPRGSGDPADADLLRGCYRSVLEIAAEFAFRSVAFPLLGSGSFPQELALKIASEELYRYIPEHEETTILLVIRDRSAFRPDPKQAAGLKEYIRFIREQEKQKQRREMNLSMVSTESFPVITQEQIEAEERRQSELARPAAEAPIAFAPRAERKDASEPRTQSDLNVPTPSLSGAADGSGVVVPLGAFRPDRGLTLDESFSEMVLRKIDERGYSKDSDCYTKGNIDRRLFHRIRSGKNYHPSKITALSMAVALELSLEETNELLSKAGYCLSHSIAFDVIIEYCIMQKNYNLIDINSLLFSNEQPLLGE